MNKKTAKKVEYYYLSVLYPLFAVLIISSFVFCIVATIKGPIPAIFGPLITK